VKRLITETGAGQWGGSLAFAGSVFGVEVQVFMVRVSCDQKPYRREIESLMDAKAGSREGDRLDILVTLVEAYERQHFPLDLSARLSTFFNALGIRLREAYGSCRRRSARRWCAGTPARTSPRWWCPPTSCAPRSSRAGSTRTPSRRGSPRP
jgi:hypothetical protein